MFVDFVPLSGLNEDSCTTDWLNTSLASAGLTLIISKPLAQSVTIEAGSEASLRG